MPVRLHRPNTSLAVLVVLGGLTGAAGCDRAGSVEPPPVADPAPGVDAYSVAIAHFVGDPDGPPDDQPDPLPVLYLVPLDEPMGIEDQATVIEAFSASHDVRFVDDLTAAVDVEQPGRPPRDDAIVLGLGPIDAEPPHRLRVEQYRSGDDVEATLLTLEYDVDRWVVITAERVPAEALTDVG